MTNHNNITRKAQQVDEFVAQEGRATRQMIADHLGVSGPRANELINQLIDANRVEKVARGIYEHEYYSHRPPATDLDQLHQFDESMHDWASAVAEKLEEEHDIELTDADPQ